jgi:hypothetical protein
MSSCDTLYVDAPSESGEEQFGSTCGDTRDATDGSCA